MLKMTPKKIISRSILYVLLAGIAFFWIYPFLWMISTAFKTNAEVIASLSLIPNELRLDNFVKAWIEARFAQYFFNTVLITVTVVLIVLTTCSMAGYSLGRRKFIGKKVFIALIVATMFIPQAFTIIPVYDLMTQLGLLNTRWAVILSIAGGAHVVFILLFAAQYSQVPIDLEHAAVIDGCGFVRTFIHVMFPAALPIAATVTIFQFIQTWNAFLIPLVMTLGKPKLRTLAVGLLSFVGEYTIDWAGLAAGAAISVMPVIVVFLFVQRYFIKGLAGAVKG
jgi:raffinose/stachyose/melibiose transport system permease protein